MGASSKMLIKSMFTFLFHLWGSDDWYWLLSGFIESSILSNSIALLIGIRGARSVICPPLGMNILC